MTQVSYAVILTRGVERAAAALHSLAGQGPSFELLLVLNDADGAMRELADAWVARGARVVHDGADLGVMLAYNVALRSARSPLLCTVHEDAELGAGCVERLIATMHAHPEAGAVAPSVDTPDLAGGDANIVWSDGATSAVVTSDPGPVRATDYGGSSCLLLRRDVLAALGGFDAAYFPAIYGDVDVGVRLWRAGWAVLCDRRAHHLHRTAAMVDAARGPRHGVQHRRFLVERNRVRFVARHAEWLGAQARRSNPEDARRPEEHEVIQAMARLATRWRGLQRPPAAPGPSRVELPDDLEGSVAELRRGVTEEFLEHLLEREGLLAAENARLHEAFAALHAEHVALNAEAGRIHRAYAELHVELDRVHTAHAALLAEQR